MLVSLVLVGWVASLVGVVDGIEKLGESWMIITSYLGVIAALCGLGFVVLVKGGTFSFRGWVQALGWPVVGVVTRMGLLVVGVSWWDCLDLSEEEGKVGNLEEGKIRKETGGEGEALISGGEDVNF